MTTCEHIEQAQAGLDSVEVYLDVHGDPDSAQICQLDALLALGHALTSVARSLETIARSLEPSAYRITPLFIAGPITPEQSRQLAARVHQVLYDWSDLAPDCGEPTEPISEPARA